MDGEFFTGKLGDGLYNVGKGCSGGCKGCNIDMSKSKIKDEVKKINEKAAHVVAAKGAKG